VNDQEGDQGSEWSRQKSDCPLFVIEALLFDLEFSATEFVRALRRIVRVDRPQYGVAEAVDEPRLALPASGGHRDRLSRLGHEQISDVKDGSDNALSCRGEVVPLSIANNVVVTTNHQAVHKHDRQS
jgi:hypothetical protein